MRNFGSLALKQVRSRRARSLLTAAGIVLGVGMILGVLLLSATINRTFTDLYDSVYGRADLIVSGGGQEESLPKRAFGEVETTPGVDEAVGRIQSVFTLVDDKGEAPPDATKQLNVAGQDPDAANVTDSETVAGRDPERGREISVQDTWADANEIEVSDRISLATPDGERRFSVVGLFKFQSGFEFGGEGFAVMPLDAARKVMDKKRSFDEIDVIATGGAETITSLERRIDRKFGKGVDVETPQTKSEDVESQLQAFNAILYFFAAMALFVGGFLIFNAFNMTVLQRTREIGMLRTLGTPRRKITSSVLREAALLGVLGAVLGLGLGFALAYALAEFVRALDFPVGRLTFEWWAPVAAVATGLVTAVWARTHRRAAPARRRRSAPCWARMSCVRSRARAAAGIGAALIVVGLGGAFWLGAAEETTPVVAAAGMTGTVAIFFGIAMVAPFVVKPLVSILSWPVRRILPVEGRLASDAARSDPGRTAATATALLIGLSLVVAVNSLGSSFLGTISDEFDRAFARDLTVQPSGLSPGQGTQQTIGDRLSQRLEKIPEAAVVARERFLFTTDLPGPKGKTKSDGLIIGFEPTEYEEVDTTDIQGAPREEVFKRMNDGEVTVGKGYADEEDLEVGDTLRLEGSSGDQKARIAGIVETVLFGGQTVGMSLDTLRRVYGVTADSELALKATSVDERAVLEDKVRRIVREDYPNLAVLSNTELKANVEDQVNQQFATFYAIVGVAIFASLFGIINTLTMSVLERTREIGVLRALGASRWQIRRQVASESVVIGLVGALLGVAVGTGLGWALLQGLAAGVPGVSYRPPIAAMVAVAVAGIVLGLDRRHPARAPCRAPGRDPGDLV